MIPLIFIQESYTVTFGLLFPRTSTLSFPLFPGHLFHLFSLVFSGEKGTLSHGAIVGGKFEGFIQSYHGTYYVEPAERYLDGRNVPFHSVIYHEDDIRESARTRAAPARSKQTASLACRRSQAAFLSALLITSIQPNSKTLGHLAA